MSGEGEEGRAQDGTVLRAAAALDPDPAGTVVGHREEATGVGGSLLPDQGRLVAALGAIGVDDVSQMAGGAGQLAGVEPPRLLQQHALGPGPQGRAGRQGVDGVADDGRLDGRRLPSAERLQGGGPLGDQLLGVDHSPASLAPRPS